MFANLNTRTVQDQLWLAQYNLGKCTDAQMRDIYKTYISDLATELLYRYRQQNKEMFS